MAYSVICFAGFNIGVEHNFPQFENCDEYLSDDKNTDFTVSVNAEDIAKEREISISQCRYERIPYPNYSEKELENTAIYRKIANEIYKYNAVVFHGSAIAVKNQAYLFTAPSGTGKTTHTMLWLKNIPDSFVVNGDKPIIRFFEDGIKVCGTPWSGKENMSKNVCVPLKAVCILERDAQNSISEIPFKDAFSHLLGSTYRPGNRESVLSIISLIKTLGKDVKFYKLQCNMEDSAAQVSFGGMQ